MPQTAVAVVKSVKGGVPARAPHVPAEGTKSYRLLGALLKGVAVDAGYAYTELNLPTLQARASELRKLGWPVRAIERPHPKLVHEMTTFYLLDGNFRQWIAQNPDRHPSHYPGQEGRGKYLSINEGM
jgi:hypothetical protein